MSANVSMTRKEFNVRFKRFKMGIAIDLVTALQQRCPVDKGILKNSIKHRITGAGIEIYMKKYAVYVEFGTPPHIIRPKNAKALHWTQSGVGPRGGKVKTDVFAKVVHHPGTRPNPFIRTTFRQDLSKIIKQNAWRHFA